jgi:UDP-galactopyranose mutase
MNYDIVCFSHLRWDFVFQRPQQLMTRLAARRRIFFIEEPVYDAAGSMYIEARKDDLSDVNIITPHLGAKIGEDEARLQEIMIVQTVLRFFAIRKYVLWHYSPMSYPVSAELTPLYRVYDCMDELSNFLYAPPELKENEAALMSKADIVFTGGNSLHQAKRGQHSNIFCFPSSIDKDHFGVARQLRITGGEEPEDQQSIGGPRIGFFGVIDERLNVDLLREVAVLRPEWQLILIGPVVKIDPATLPRRDNIHYLGARPYKDLPGYLAGWDIAMMPFAQNASTEFISPTKTPEYLAGGVPVIAPSIRDVVHPYFDLGLVLIADTAREFVRAADGILTMGMPKVWPERVNNFLSSMSWDLTVADMERLIDEGIANSAIYSSQNNRYYNSNHLQKNSIYGKQRNVQQQ